jgi:hypothetical protein
MPSSLRQDLKRYQNQAVTPVMKELMDTGKASSFDSGYDKLVGEMRGILYEG